MGKLTCRRCGERPPVSSTTLLCDVCLYRELMGDERADRQVALATAAAERAKEQRAQAARRAGAGRR